MWSLKAITKNSFNTIKPKSTILTKNGNQSIVVWEDNVCWFTIKHFETEIVIVNVPKLTLLYDSIENLLFQRSLLRQNFFIAIQTYKTVNFSLRKMQQYFAQWSKCSFSLANKRGNDLRATIDENSSGRASQLVKLLVI